MSAVTHVGPCFDRFLKNASEERQEQTDGEPGFHWVTFAGHVIRDPFIIVSARYNTDGDVIRAPIQWSVFCLKEDPPTVVRAWCHLGVFNKHIKERTALLKGVLIVQLPDRQLLCLEP